MSSNSEFQDASSEQIEQSNYEHQSPVNESDVGSLDTQKKEPDSIYEESTNDADLNHVINDDDVTNLISSGADAAGASKVQAEETTEVEEALEEPAQLQQPFVATSSDPPLPDRKSIKDCLRLDQPNAIINESTDNKESLEKLNFISNTYESSSKNFLLQSKFNELNREFELKDLKAREQINSGSETIKKTFNDIKNTVGSLNNDFFTDYKIDWDFWTRVVNNYELVIKNDSNELNENIMKGIPKEFRGIIWQLISKSKNFHLEEFYLQLKGETSIHEKSIKRDLTRTSFFTNVDQIKKTDELFNVIKAYSLFDPDVGYTQGMIFIVVPLIMNMNESECFGLLVTLMKDYRLRDLFCPEMKGLHLLLYEFDRLLELYSPRLYNHLVKQGIKSSMYASQWFLTFFAYKFPLDIVLRIYDIIITQGIESILKFSVNLMIKNESNLTQLKFDKLLDYLKSNLFDIYVSEEFINYNNGEKGGDSRRNSANLGRSPSVSKRFSILNGSGSNNNKSPPSNNSGSSYYKLDQFVSDAMNINVIPLDLNKFEFEFENIYVNEKSKVKEIEDLTVENGKLRHEVKLLETEYSNVNRDHVDIVQQMVDYKITLPELLNENEDITKQIEQLRVDIEDLQSKIVSSPESESSPSLNSNLLKSPALPTKIEHDIQELLVINAQETEKFANLEEEYQNLLLEDENLTNELKTKTSKKWFPWN